MKRIDDRHFELSTGRRFTANGGVIGLEPGDPDLSFSTGWDYGEDVDDWTLEERQELADYMVQMWREWGQRATTKQTP